MENRIFWVDCEMTGLDYMGKGNRSYDIRTSKFEFQVVTLFILLFILLFSDKIMEFASVVTDGQFNLIKEGPEFVVHISEDELSAMDEWCTRTHGQTGLTEKCRNSKIKISDSDKQVADFIKENCPRAPIAGNSVHMDLNFMRKEMPLSTKELHYR